MFKKITGMLLLAVMFCFGMTSVTAFAASESLTQAALEKYKSGTGDYDLTGGTYVLDENLEIGTEIHLIAGENGITIDLNGHDLTFTAPTGIISVFNKDVTIRDSKNKGAIRFYEDNYQGIAINNFDRSKNYELLVDSVVLYGNITTGSQDKSVVTIKNSKVYNITNPLYGRKSVTIRNSKLIIDNSYIYGGVQLAGDMDFLSGQIGEEGSGQDSLILIREKFDDSTPYTTSNVTFGVPGDQKDEDVYIVGNTMTDTWVFDELTINHLKYGKEGYDDGHFSIDFYVLDPDKFSVNSFTYNGNQYNLHILKNKLDDYSNLYNISAAGYMNKEETKAYLKKVLGGKKVFGDVEFHGTDEYTTLPYITFFHALAADKNKPIRIGSEQGSEFTEFYTGGGNKPSGPSGPEKPEEEPVETSFVISGLNGLEAKLPVELIKSEDGKYILSYNKKTKIKLPNKNVMLRTGYEFSGWLNQDSKKVSVLNSKSLGTLTTLTASWKPNTYKIKYKFVYPERGYKTLAKLNDKNKYQYDVSKVTILGEGVTALSKLDGAPVYKLKGWTTDKEKAMAGTAECMYLAGEKELINLAGATKKDKTLTLYPVWEK